MGNLIGAGRIITDSSFGSHVARITDAATNPGIMNRTYTAGQGGSSDANIWNVDSTLLFIYDTGGGMFPMTFRPTFDESRTIVHLQLSCGRRAEAR